MKISKIEIFDYNQFKNFTIDLTYPKGHKKEGLPLDKVCFIGQNGTGKTTLLNVIKELVVKNRYTKSVEHNETNEVNKFYEITVYQASISDIKISKTKYTDVLNSGLIHTYIQKTDLDWEAYFAKKKTLLINIPSEMIDFDLSHKLDDPLKYIKPSDELELKEGREKAKLSIKNIFDFTEDNPIEIWKAILFDNSEYLLKERNFKNRIADELLKENAQTDKIINELKLWKEQNPNPFVNIASKLNPILEKFNLKIKTDIDLRTPDDLYFIQIQSINNEVIPLSGWSSGTKRIILTAAPLIKLDTWQTIILIDEPESSLYPDTQYNIIDYYTKMAPDAQFFVATHSPIVAASFEPWEIVELKFNEEGRIFQDLYFKGERHIDNYFIQPQYLRWDSILYKLFDVVNDGNSARKTKLFELSEKGLKLKRLKEQGNANQDDVKKLWEEYKGIAELLDWKIETA